MNTSRASAGRLIMTEQAFFSSAAQKDCFVELDVEQFEIVATLDSRTSEICRGMDGKHFPMSEWKIGVTAPPFHVNCRSTTVPFFADDFGVVGERAARDEATGETYYVPANMTYKQWKQAFVDGDKSELQEIISDAKIKDMNIITQTWLKDKGTKGVVSELQEYIINGTTYKVDGKQVILRPTEQEREVAAILSGKYGKNVQFVPQIMYPQSIQTPDYLIDGERFDLKSPTGKSKNLLYNLVSKKESKPTILFLMLQIVLWLMTKLEDR